MFPVNLFNDFISLVDDFNTSSHKFMILIHDLMCSSHMVKPLTNEFKISTDEFQSLIHDLVCSSYIINSSTQDVHHIYSRRQYISSGDRQNSYMLQLISSKFHYMISRIIELIYNETYKIFELIVISFDITIIVYYFLRIICKYLKIKNQLYKNLYSTSKSTKYDLTYKRSNSFT